MRGWMDSIESEWQDAVLRWKSAASEFQAAKTRLESNGGKAQQLGQQEYNDWLDQLDYANRIQTAVEMLAEGLASTSDWAKRALGLGMIGRMGAIPLIPIAVITGSIATVVTATYAINSYNAEMDARWNYIRANPDMTPEQATAILNSSGADVTGGFGDAMGEVGKLATWIAVGGLLLYFGPMLLAVRPGGNKR